MRSSVFGVADKYLSTLNIGLRIALLTALPLLAMIGLAFLLVSQSLHETSEGSHVLRLADRVPVMAGLVHELQIERGMTSGFMSSGGAQFGTELPKQRQVVDTVLAEYESSFVPEALAGFDDSFKQAIGASLDMLKGLAANRAAVDANSIKVPEALGFYTRNINAIFSTLGVSISLVEDPATVQNLLTLQNIALAKEAAGLERAVGAATYATGKIDAPTYQRLAGLIGAQKAHLDEFAALAGPKILDAYNSKMTASELKTFDTYRKNMLDAPFNPDALAGITGPQWFAAATDRINRLHDIELLANDVVVSTAERVNADANARLVSNLVIDVLIVAASIFLAIVISRSIVRPIKRMTNTMVALAEGDTGVEITRTEQRDEIGGMARAVQVFKENAIKVSAMSAEEHERVEQARMRAEAMSELIDGLGLSVDAAVEGDFSRRVTLTGGEDDLNKVANGVNQLLETVERALGEIGAVLSSLAEKDLTKRVATTYSGAFETLRADTNSVAERLSEIIGRLQGTSHTLKTATREILSGANDLSERTTRQAATIEETSAAMEQLSHTVMDSAGKAKDASAEAQKASHIVEEGAEVMGRATEAMTRISTSSDKISNIIGMIDDISFQTNLLALNASVEAARAGEAGKGFAVVAVEVRRLAQSAAEASAGVKELIEESSQEVKSGSHLVDEVAQRLTKILDAVNSNAQLLEGIATDSHEQANAIGEITVAVRQMDEMTQQNAALVEEMNAAIEQTESQASDLDDIVELFEITETTHALRRAS